MHRSLPIRDLPPDLIGRTLVQISDLHVGPRVDDDYVIKTFRRVAELRPDVVVFTGDFITYHPPVFAQLPRVYRHFSLGRLATFAILGNHDYLAGRRRLYINRGVGPCCGYAATYGPRSPFSSSVRRKEDCRSWPVTPASSSGR